MFCKFKTNNLSVVKNKLLQLEKIMVRFEEASLKKCLNALWMLVISLEKGTLKKFSAFVAMLHYLQVIPIRSNLILQFKLSFVIRLSND